MVNYDSLYKARAKTTIDNKGGDKFTEDVCEFQQVLMMKEPL